MNLRVMIGVAMLIAWGACKPSQESSRPSATQQAPQGAGVIDTMTQKSKIEAGKRAASKVREIGEEQQRDLDEVMGE